MWTAQSPLLPVLWLLIVLLTFVQSSVPTFSSSSTSYCLASSIPKSERNDVIVTLSGSHSISKQINDTRSLQRWLTKEDTIRKILSVNPAMSDIKMLSPTLFKSRLAKMSMPGFEIEQSLLFEIHVNSTAVVLSAKKGTVEQRFKGSKMLVNFFSKLTPSEVVSSTVISLQYSPTSPSSSSLHSPSYRLRRLFKRHAAKSVNHEYLSSSDASSKGRFFSTPFKRKKESRRLFASMLPVIPSEPKLAGILSIQESVSVNLRLPSWLPSPKRLVASTGSKSIQKTISRNIKLFADNILSLYQRWEEQENE